ncbi:MAG: carotenoid 1,2-hydratase, partial [bacterium]|nr:carotenoid 1,2-hydratase [bacterium]
MRALLAVLLLLACCAAGWRSAGAPYRFVFPRDHGSHPAYHTEWWYYTGHLSSTDGRRYGFELTIFRVGLAPGAPTPGPGESRWRDGELFPAHFAVTDDTNGTFSFSERVARPALGQAGAARGGLDVHALDWYARGEHPLRLHAATPALGLDLTLTSRKLPAINGLRGISRKGSCAS